MVASSKICHGPFLTVTLVDHTRAQAKVSKKKVIFIKFQPKVVIYSTKHVSNDLNLNGILYSILYA